MQEISIAYGGMSPNFDAPGDRRRFSGFAERQNLIFESLTREMKKTDVAILTLGADLSQWKTIKQSHGRIILDIVDSYFDESIFSPKRILRGTYKSLKNDIKKPHLRYTELMRRVVENADAVVCASLEQKKMLEIMNPNIHVINDCFDELIDDRFQERAVPPSKIVMWEGMTDNLKHLELLKIHESNLELVVVTSSTMRRKRNPFQDSSTIDYLHRHDIQSTLVPWSITNLKAVANKCAASVIPINSSNRVAWGKSENKLLGLWALGIPVLASPTPSYKRVLREALLPECLVGDADWSQQLLKLTNDPEAASRIARQGYDFASIRVRGEYVDKLWRQSLISVGISV